MCTAIDFNILLPIYLGEECFHFDFSQLFWEMSRKSWEMSYKFGRSPFLFNDRMCTTLDFNILLPTLLGEACFYFDFSQHFWEMSGKSWEKSYKFGRFPIFSNDRKCTKFVFDILLPTLLGEACVGFRHLPKYLGDVCLYLGEVRIKFTCFSQTFLTSPNFF